MKTLTTQELKQWMNEKKDFLLIDALGLESYAKKHLPGAKMIDAHQEDFLQKVESTAGNKEKNVVVYCASFDCPLSTNAAQQLTAAGFTNVYDYEGGLKDWKEAGNALHENCPEQH